MDDGVFVGLDDGVFVGFADGKALGLLVGVIEGVADRKSTRLNSSHGYISYAVFCLKKKKINKNIN